ncbi:MAG TPA: tryptophan--tRNA ligase, partial [Chloroflexi bacterium]|nr:tryptophan--tRNA ligase [Chloroflexota bacterium]
MPETILESSHPGAATPGRRLRVLSGMQPTGRMHVGNYLGALRNWVQLQDGYECIFFVADYHSLTEATDPASIRPATVEMVLDWLAAGIDPERSTAFLQSDLPEVAELHLLLSMSTPLGWLERVPTYKEKVAQFPDNQNYGLLGYPVL